MKHFVDVRLDELEVLILHNLLDADLERRRKIKRPDLEKIRTRERLLAKLTDLFQY